MTQEPMVASRELDALVAEKVMGWKWVVTVPGAHDQAGMKIPEWCRVTMGMRYLREPDWNPGAIGLQALSDGSEPKAPLVCDYCAIFPHYSTDIADAWLVIERIRQNFPHQKTTQAHAFQLCRSGRPGEWHCVFSVNEYDWSHQAYADADTAPLAICSAALKAAETTSEAATIRPGGPEKISPSGEATA